MTQNKLRIKGVNTGGGTTTTTTTEAPLVPQFSPSSSQYVSSLVTTYEPDGKGIIAQHISATFNTSNILQWFFDNANDGFSSIMYAIHAPGEDNFNDGEFVHRGTIIETYGGIQDVEIKLSTGAVPPASGTWTFAIYKVNNNIVIVDTLDTFTMVVGSPSTTTTTTEEPTTTTTTTEDPTTTTTTTEPVFYTYDFSSFGITAKNDFSDQFDKAGVTNWDGTYRIVATNLNIGTPVYYIGTDGNKHLFTFNNVVFQDESNFINFGQTGIVDNVGTVTFDSVTPFVVTTTTTTTAAPFTVYNFSSFLNEDKQQFAEILMQYIQANSLMPWDGTFRIVASDISLGNIVYYIGTDGNKYPFTGYLEDVNGNIDFNVTQGLFDVTGTMSWTSTAPF